MKAGTIAALLLLAAGPALAHGYRAGPLEIIHPAVMVPGQRMDCACAHVKIVNHGKATEHFLGAIISAASHTNLIAISSGGRGLEMPPRVAIAPGATLDLSRHGWCLFMSGIATTLEPDMGAIPGQLLFENQGGVDIEFMIDEAH